MEFSNLTLEEVCNINGGGWDMDEATVAKAVVTLTLITGTAQAIYDSGRGAVKGAVDGFSAGPWF